MPISKYYKGHGKEVMSAMKKKYGEKKGEEVFYRTANKKKMKPKKAKHHSCQDGKFIDDRRSL